VLQAGNDLGLAACFQHTTEHFAAGADGCVTELRHGALLSAPPTSRQVKG
jgi:hypothetical protein